ncbi:hypothetical protein OAN12_03845 [Halioglobus sp.]|nr:hypothetical protein [Halioglobus sp.]
MDIDVYNPDNYTRGIPHDQFAWLRKNAPVHWHEHPGGHGYWVLSKHADVLAVSRDFRTFSAEQGFVLVDDLPAEILDMARNQLLGMDPPKHGPPPARGDYSLYLSHAGGARAPCACNHA